MIDYTKTIELLIAQFTSVKKELENLIRGNKTALLFK